MNRRHRNHALASHPTPRPSGEFVGQRHALITREEECALGKCIEEANRALLEAIWGSPLVTRELSFVLDADGGGGAEEPLEEPTEGADVPAVPAAGANASEASGPAEAPRALSRNVVALLLDRLEAVRREAHGPDRKSLSTSIAEIERQRDAGEQAITSLVEANIGLVFWMANKRALHGMSLGDLVQEGSLGLIRAAEKYEYRRGIRFNTYATWWIRHFMNRALSDQSRTIRLPVHLVETRSKVLRAAREFRQERGREPSESELAERTGVTGDKLRLVLAVPGEPVSLDAPIGAEGDTRIGDLVADPDAQRALEDLSTQQIQKRLRELLSTLKPREQEVLRLRYGIDRPDGLTLSEVGEHFSLSRERIRQIEGMALAKLRRHAEDEDLGAHLTG